MILMALLMVCGSLATQKKQKKEKSYLPVSDEPITAEMCNLREYEKLHMCIAYKRNQPKVKELVKEYACMFDNYHRRQTLIGDEALHGKVKGLYSRINATSHAEAIVKQHVSGGSATTSRAFASSTFSLRMNGTSMSAMHKIHKRSTADQRNPCSGSLLQAIIYLANDKDTGEELELVHDPGEENYQSFFVRLCNQFQYSGFECARHDLIFRALVYVDPPDVSDDVGTRFVRTKGSCALSRLEAD